MAVFRYPAAPNDSTFVRGVEFIDGISADVEVSADTLTVFDAYGITRESDAEPSIPEAVANEKPKRAKSKE